ncbi:MAG: hypothetical protein AAFN78_01680 [Pseudomonadota bacterium]
MLAVAVGLLIAANNVEEPLPPQARLADSLDAGIEWLHANRNDMLANENPILWYFVHRSAELADDPRLTALVDAHRKKYIDPELGTYVWEPMFNPDDPGLPLDFDAIVGLNHYSQHMLYATNCSAEIGRLDSIQAQNEPGFCGPAHLFKPTCATHQLMGIRFLQRAECGDADKNAATVRELQRMIRREITLDPRVLDAYIQRALMLVESGDTAPVKGIWIRRILDQQRADGGWGNFQPLMALSDKRFLGFGSGQSRARGSFLKVFRISRPTSTFHATAQGVLLTALLVHGE